MCSVVLDAKNQTKTKTVDRLTKGKDQPLSRKLQV